MEFILNHPFIASWFLSGFVTLLYAYTKNNYTRFKAWVDVDQGLEDTLMGFFLFIVLGTCGGLLTTLWYVLDDVKKSRKNLSTESEDKD